MFSFATLMARLLICFSFFFQPLCQPYYDLATSYSTNDPNDLRMNVNKHSEVFTKVKDILMIPAGFISNSLLIMYVLPFTQVIYRYFKL